jgi:hypothetical protein
MPYRRTDADFLREKARAFRRIAAACDPVNAAKLTEAAGELEAKAAEIEQRPDPRKPH